MGRYLVARGLVARRLGEGGGGVAARGLIARGFGGDEAMYCSWGIIRCGALKLQSRKGGSAIELRGAWA